MASNQPRYIARVLCVTPPISFSASDPPRLLPPTPVPQSSQVVEVLIGHWVFASGFARVLDMIFWMSSYHELVDHSGSKMVGVFVLLTQFVHILLMIDFFYYYINSLRLGLPMQLPRQSGMV